MQQIIKQAFIGSLVGKAAGAVFGSKKHSLASNIKKNTILTGVLGGIPGMNAQSAINKTKVNQALTNGKGFKMGTTNLPKTSGLAGIKLPTVKGLGTTKKLTGVIGKGAAPKSALGAISPASGTSPKSVLAKSAGDGKSQESLKGLNTLGLMGAGAIALKGVDELSKKFKEYSHKRKFPKIIDYAKQSNPELKKVPSEKLHAWMNSFYRLAPHLTKDKGLATSMLSTVHNYGGNLDLATAKIIAEMGHRSKKDKGSASDGLKNSLSLLID
jgi:hypothetical protein